MQTMQVIEMTAAGEPDVLTLAQRPVPEISRPSQVRVRMKAAGVNPIDTKLRRNGTFFPKNLPAVLGMDGAGVVDEVGSQVSEFAPGDEVYFCCNGLGREPG
ncbi:MAG: alcohol dehydrogenase catalytic domain-containing protein, partial [Gammaproteobacteria bacterium]